MAKKANLRYDLGSGLEEETVATKGAKFLPSTKLRRTPASDVKRLGWRGMMSAMRRDGKLLVTNHEQPEAVIVPVEEYDALMQLVEQSQAQAESMLVGLRSSFDQRLSSLQHRSAGTRLRSAIRAGTKLNGKLKAGSHY